MPHLVESVSSVNASPSDGSFHQVQVRRTSSFQAETAFASPQRRHSPSTPHQTPKMSAVVEKVTDAVHDVTNALSNTAINDKANESKPAANNEAVLASAAEGRRLYIGNLAYATTEGELKEFFKGYLVSFTLDWVKLGLLSRRVQLSTVVPTPTFLGAEIFDGYYSSAELVVVRPDEAESVSIPKNPRTDRPVGYAFVDLSTPTEAERAISELSGKEVLERKVSVQLARKPEPAGEKTEGGNGEGGEEGHRRRSSGRGRGRGRGGRGARGGRDAKDEGATDSAAAPENAAQATDEGQALADVANKDASDKAKKSNQARPPRERRERGPPADGIASKTKVMVANLPYDLTEEKLKELFQAYQPSSAKIALRPIPRFMIKKLQARGEPRKGRGFGFVTLASEEMQQKAVQEMNGKEIEGREIAVKVAIDSPDKTDDDAHAPEEKANGADAAGPADAPAATPSADAPTETPTATTTA
ncbi:hypothetical protein SODALDRAFT_378539 [Sodiomyces alkalinus F11]|uniref:RRM domain-containing protein n=1 Tax=Sodiomyces alkalinus (strain CBS 110278 / VKM F-3762 / F11) TaxID=1314773 RepID=A0A3N2PYC9_SODAK|nr:hypothetical protein SODALDRAFT_378539 [Sodiomyces alkalinus F11]ROT39448.1 hypothetical protein SODALDRAFT_378539 [Sodiomyces alkalinus F11]